MVNDNNNNDRYQENETKNYNEVLVRKVSEVEFNDKVR